jgi:undecaprenyl phosphate N,N'-diacetylbacillosamine 1-phosphate transferase
MKVRQVFVKRLMDISVSALALVVSFPALLIIALLVRLDSKGPSLFRQKRAGKDGEPFTCYKFRTMYVDAPDIRNLDGSTFNAKDDPRVTRIGRFLRMTSLDELPQLINILKGEMSLVGPRPDQVDQLQYYTEEEKRKLLVKPGITGLAQINGRNAVPWEQRKRLDLEYVEKQSVGLDLRILLLTIPCILRQRGIFIETESDDITT